ncbi:MAG: aspartate 1-decarboxylase [candidate division Zixibacteria bacterium RBG_16_50_21]|nr:MAG: aspartate 1-decarboxylase [candidate division Zixibacteria bacterium RBG_16_50_21]
MLIQICKSKIHRARVTQARLDYEGSLTIDSVLMKKAGVIPFEKVQVVNLNNGERFETYLIEGKAHTGTICLNGPAARLGQVGDEVIIIAYACIEPKEAQKIKPKLVYLDSKNRIRR